MGSYVIRMKVLPTGPEVPVQTLVDSIKGSLKQDMVLRSSREEPIAFGLYALMIDVVTPDVEGNVDKVEDAIAHAPNVSQSELHGVSRLSSQLKNV